MYVYIYIYIHIYIYNMYIQYNTIRYNTIQYNTIHYTTLPYHTIPYHTIPYHTIPYHTIQYNTIQYNTSHTEIDTYIPLSIYLSIYLYIYIYIHMSLWGVRLWVCFLVLQMDTHGVFTVLAPDPPPPPPPRACGGIDSSPSGILSSHRVQVRDVICLAKPAWIRPPSGPCIQSIHVCGSVAAIITEARRCCYNFWWANCIRPRRHQPQELRPTMMGSDEFALSERSEASDDRLL